MRFARAFGSEGHAPGQFKYPWGLAAVRGLIVVSEHGGTCVQVLTPKGVPLQVLKLGTGLRGLCADEQRNRVWVTNVYEHRVLALTLKES